LNSLFYDIAPCVIIKTITIFEAFIN